MNVPKFLKYIDGISRWVGVVTAWLMLFLVLELVYDTVARYAFNAPTIWSFDISYMIYSIMFMLGGAYTLLDKEHIRVDMFYERFSRRWKSIVDIIGYLLFYFPVMGGLLFFGIIFTNDSWQLMEHCTKSYWSPPVYHFKALIPITAVLMLLQGSADFIRAIAGLTPKEEEF